MASVSPSRPSSKCGASLLDSAFAAPSLSSLFDLIETGAAKSYGGLRPILCGAIRYQSSRHSLKVARPFGPLPSQYFSSSAGACQMFLAKSYRGVNVDHLFPLVVLLMIRKTNCALPNGRASAPLFLHQLKHRRRHRPHAGPQSRLRERLEQT